MENTFEKFKLSREIINSLDGLKYRVPSKVQEEVIPIALENKDIIVKSQTGSGKTASFAIPMCEKVIWELNNPQGLVLTPTRELAVQVKEEISSIGIFKRIKVAALFGKQPFSEQVNALKQKTHIVVGTPGRVLDHINRGTLDISSIKYLVIDEGDEMFNMGFISQVEEIIKETPKDRVTMLFSATIPQEIKLLCNKYMKLPLNIEIQQNNLITDKIENSLYNVEEGYKSEMLRGILIIEKPESAVIFCRTKENVDKLFRKLSSKHYSVGKIHGGMLQKERLEVMEEFKRGRFRLLVSTDVAARGIDVEGITHVINYDIPVEKEAYVHRIGRTGRAGRKGKAITLKTKYEDKLLKEIEEYIGFNITNATPLDEELVKINIKEGEKILKLKPQIKEKKNKEVTKSITKIYLNGGKKKKIRPGDIVGAISRIDGVVAEDIGIIDVQDMVSYVDILNGKGKLVIDNLKKSTIKGKKLRVEKAKGK